MMYWDSLTATGVIVSIIITLGAFYLFLREPLIIRRREARHS